MNSTAKRTAKGNTRNKLLTTAHELFVKRGIDRVSIHDISKESGVHLSLVNYYFQSRRT